MDARSEKNDLLERLRVFLEIHNKTKILDHDIGTLKMHVLLAKNKNTKGKEKLINYKLLRLNERLLVEGPELDERNRIICEFLVEELEKYYASAIAG